MKLKRPCPRAGEARSSGGGGGGKRPGGKAKGQMLRMTLLHFSPFLSAILVEPREDVRPEEKQLPEETTAALPPPPSGSGSAVPETRMKDTRPFITRRVIHYSGSLFPTLRVASFPAVFILPATASN